MCLSQRHELSPALPVHCKPPTAPSAAGGGAPGRLRGQGGTSGCHSHPDGCVTAHGHLYAVPTPEQRITNTGTGFLSKLSRKQGSAGTGFKPAWHVNLNIHKSRRQLLGGFTMHHIFCHCNYIYIHCKLVLERRDALACEKPTENIPSALTFSTHDCAVIMQ